MINVELTQEEYNFLLSYRKGKYNIDISESEYDLIVQHRNKNIKAYEKYIENVERYLSSDNNAIKDIAIELYSISNKLKNSEVSIDDYKKIDIFSDIDLSKLDDKDNVEIGQLDYIKKSIELHYPN